MAAYFDKAEIDTLLVFLNLPSAAIHATTLRETISNLIAYCDRHGRTADLIAYCQTERPHVTWPAI